MAANIFRRGCRGGAVGSLGAGWFMGDWGGVDLGAGRDGWRGAIGGFDCVIDGVEWEALTFNI